VFGQPASRWGASPFWGFDAQYGNLDSIVIHRDFNSGAITVDDRTWSEVLARGTGLLEKRYLRRRVSLQWTAHLPRWVEH